MNVLIVMPSSLLGGAERVASNMAEHLLERGDKVTVLTMSRGPGTHWPALAEHERFRHIAISSESERRGVVALLRLLPELARSEPFDLVYTSHVHVNALISLLMRLRLLRARYLVSRESTKIFDRFRGPRRLLFRALYALYGRQDLLVFQTTEMRDALAGTLRLPRRIAQRVIPNPVNKQAIDRALRESSSPVPSTGAEPPFQIIYCGRLIALKRVSLLLRALALLDRSDWRLTILGDGPLRAELEAESIVLGLTDRVAILGNVRNPYRHFARADLGVLVSEVEGFPNVLLEMMASGTKLIASTKCTEAVAALPQVVMIEDPTAEGLSAAIAEAMRVRPDHTTIYRTYIEEKRSVRQFVTSIEKSLAMRKSIDPAPASCGASHAPAGNERFTADKSRKIGPAPGSRGR